MAESYFNEEQQAHMRELAKIPREERCASGWHRTGQCGSRPCERRRICENCKVTHSDPSRCPWVV